MSRITNQIGSHHEPNKPGRGPYYEWKGVCDICKRARSAGNHARCSKRRQALKLNRERTA